MKLPRALSFASLLLFSATAGLGAQTSTAPLGALVSELLSIQKDLIPYQGQIGRLRATRALEKGSLRFEPILKDHEREIMAEPSLMIATLKVEAALCNLDTMYSAVDSLLDLRESKQFEPALLALPTPDRSCIRGAIRFLLDDTKQDS